MGVTNNYKGIPALCPYRNSHHNPLPDYQSHFEQSAEKTKI